MGRFVTLLCIVALILDCKAQLDTPGEQCSVRGVNNFNASEFAGEWFVISRINNQVEVGICPKKDFTLGDNNVFTVTTTETDMGVENTDQYTITPTRMPQRRAEFTTDWSLLSINQDYKIIATDYTRYAIVYSCRNTCSGKSEYSWILGREKQLSNSANRVVARRLSRKGLDSTAFVAQDQSC